MSATIEQQTAAAWGDHSCSAAWAPVVDALKQLDARIAAALSANEQRVAGLRRCQWDAARDVDALDCEDPAAARVVVRYTNVDERDSTLCQFPGDVHPDVDVWLVCAFHLQRASIPAEHEQTEILSIERLCCLDGTGTKS